jgi:hypothetical protein
VILAACFGLLSGLFAPKRWKFAVVTFWAVGFVATSAIQVSA